MAQNLEIERKFLVTSDAYRCVAPTFIAQGYLNSDKARTVRVRIAGEAGFLTIKGLTQGCSRAEFEYPIPVVEARALLALCEPGRIEKWRYCVPVGQHLFEVDEFLGENAGLVVAEVELAHADQPFVAPEWLGAEVTADPRYFNSALAQRPFSSW